MTLPELGLRVVVSQLRELGITLTRRQQADLVNRLRAMPDDDPHIMIELTRAQLAKSTSLPISAPLLDSQ
jgi:hypothetical protein